MLEADGFDESAMRAHATEVGNSETAFVVGSPAPRHLVVRYFSPEIELPWCGHATVATARAERYGPGTLLFETKAGEVAVAVHLRNDHLVATLTSVAPHVRPLSADELEALLAAPALGPG